MKNNLTNEIQAAKALFINDRLGIYLKSTLFQVRHNLNNALQPLKQSLELSILRTLNFITHDLYNISILTTRLEWIRKQAESDTKLESFWRLSSSVDIEHFHVEICSIMDYVAFIISKIADKPGQVKCSSLSKNSCSFEKLFNWAKDSKNQDKLGIDIVNLILSADWFKNIRFVRNEILHGGSESIVFMKPKDGILFQLYKDKKHLIKLNEFLMNNDKIVFFDRYAAFYLTKLFLFLEKFGSLLQKKLNTVQMGKDARIGSLRVVYDWIVKLSRGSNLSY